MFIRFKLCFVSAMAVQDTGEGHRLREELEKDRGCFCLSSCSTGMWALAGGTRAQVVVPATRTTGTRGLRFLSADSMGETRLP